MPSPVQRHESRSEQMVVFGVPCLNCRVALQALSRKEKFLILLQASVSLSFLFPSHSIPLPQTDYIRSAYKYSQILSFLLRF